MPTRSRKVVFPLGRCALSAAAALWMTVAPARAVLPWTTTALSSPALEAHQDVETVWVSPDGKVAVYGVYSQGDPPQFRDLRCVRLDGRSPSRSLVSGLSDAFRYGQAVVFSPDSRRVAFTIEVPSGAQTAQELWSSPVCPDGVVAIQPVRLAPAGTPQMFASHFLVQWTPDSARVLFSVDHTVHDHRRIYSAPGIGPGGGATVELGGSEPGESVLNFFAPTADSQRVVLGRRDAGGIVDLISVPVAGPATAAIALVEGTTPDVEYPYFSSASTAAGFGRVVYLWSDAAAGLQRELWSAPLSGPPNQQVRLNPTLVAGGQVDFFYLAPDGSRVVYTADQGTNGLFELYSVPVAGPSTQFVKLSGTMAAGGPGVSPSQVRIAPDSSRVVYMATQDSAARYDLYSVPLAGPSPAGERLNEALPLGAGYVSFQISADSQSVLFFGPETEVAHGLFHLRPADGSGFELHLGCAAPAEATAIPSPTGFYLNCRRAADPTQELHHFRIVADPLFAVVTDVTPLDDLGVPVKLRAGPSVGGGALLVHDSPAVGVYELFAVDRRLLLHGFETADTTGWSAVVP
jgi:hypothetical protein